MQTTISPKANKIYLDYDPQYQGIIKVAAYLYFVCFAIFMVQTVLLATNIQLLGDPVKGDWDAFLRALDTNSLQFILIKVNFIALRTLYILTTLGYIVSVWNLNKSAAVSYVGFALVSLPVILVSQVFQMALVPLAHDYVTNGGSTGAAGLSYLLTAKTIYTMTDMGDAFVTYILFNGLLLSWAIIARKKPHPKYLSWWLVLLAILPIGRIVGIAIFSFANAVLTGLLFVVLALFMLKLRPASK